MTSLQCDDLRLSGQREDHDNATQNQNEIQTLIRDLGLTLALLHRSKKYREPEESREDINTTIVYLRKLRGYPLGAFNVPQHTVTASLVEMLAARVKGEAGNALEDINEILFFCREFASGTSPHDSPQSPGYLTSALQALTEAVIGAYSRGKQSQPLDQAIGCLKELREATKTFSLGFHRVSFNLANLLAIRFLVHHDDNDYKEAKVLLDRVTDRRPSGDHPCSCQRTRFEASVLKSALGHAQSIVNSNLEDSEKSISRCRSFLDDTPLFGNPLHPAISELLASHIPERVWKDFTPPQERATQSEVDVQLSPTQLDIFVDGFDECDIASAPLSMPLEKEIERLRGLCSEAGHMTEHQRKHLKDLLRCLNIKISLTQDTKVLEEAIQHSRSLLDIIHPTEESKFLFEFYFGNLLYVAFDRTKEVEYLHESITIHQDVLQLDSAQLTDFKFCITQQLIRSLSTRWELLGHRLDLDEVMCLFASGAEDSYAAVPSRSELACQWACTAQLFGHTSVLTAYKTAMSLMQRSILDFAPTLPVQHDRFVEMRNPYEKISLNYASHSICASQLEHAIETLEQGRSLLWSEIRGLRTSTDLLHAADPDLAARFTAINQELEMILTTSALSDGRIGLGDEGCKGDEWVELLPLLREKKMELSKEHDTLILKIRKLPGLEKFSLPLPFDTLSSAASHGPVIIINHCELGSDIIIVLHNYPPSRIPTQSDFFERANQLKDRLLKTRKDNGVQSKEHDDALSDVLKEHVLSDVLKELYELVGIPVVKRLKELRIAEQSRVWWCPTSVFWDLPLHAMGPIPSDDRVTRYFSDLYISSYTPTLSALIESRRPGAQTSSQPTLLIAKPSQSPGAWPDNLVRRGTDLQTTSLRVTSENMTPDIVLDSLQDQQFAHVAYHGMLETTRPFDAALFLCNRERLTLLDFVRSQLPAGEFAFLQGSRTAELTDGSIPDEVLHIATAVQHSGFRSVIGTLWEVDDEDGWNLAKIVYQSMFSKKEGVEPHYERSAKALQYAVQQIRSGLPLMRWVNYVHYGA